MIKLHIKKLSSENEKSLQLYGV